METAKAFFLYSFTIIMILTFIGISVLYIAHKVRDFKEDKERKKEIEYLEQYLRQQLKEKRNESNN